MTRGGMKRPKRVPRLGEIDELLQALVTHRDFKKWLGLGRWTK